MMIAISSQAAPKKGYGSKKKQNKKASVVSGPIAILSVIWRQRKVPLSYGGHVCGWHPVRPGHGSIQFESLLERDTITALARYSEVEEIISQPVTIRYHIGNQKFSYTPDFMVVSHNVPDDLEVLGFNQVTFIECKPTGMVSEDSARIDRHFRALRYVSINPPVLITEWDLTQGILRNQNV